MNQDNFSLSDKGPSFGPKINGVVINGALEKDAYVRLGFLRLNKNEAYLKNPDRSLATTILDKIFAPKPYEVSKAQKKKRYLQQAAYENQLAGNFESNNYYSSARQSSDYNPAYQRNYYDNPEYSNNARMYTPIREEKQEIAYQKVSPHRYSPPEEKIPSKKVEFDSSNIKKSVPKSEQKEKPATNTSTNQRSSVAVSFK